MGAETTPTLRLLQRPRPLARRLVVGRIGAHEVGVLTCGVGAAKAAERTAAALAGWRADRVVSFGTCGALVDAHDVGDVLHVDRLLSEEGEVATLQPLGTPVVTLVTVRAGVWDPLTRDRLAARGAAACEMEAAAIAAVCGSARMHVVKVVSDRAGGEPDAVIPADRKPAARPGPLEVARFKARALKLVDRHLVPVLAAALHAAS